MFENLVPQKYPLANGATLQYFVSANLPLVKLDFTFEAGSRYQSKKCLAAAANQLLGKASAAQSAAEVAEFLDFRGIILERSIDVCTGTLTAYFLRSYAEELFPLLRDLLESPVIPEQSFAAHVAKRRMQLQSGMQKTSVQARNAFYAAAFGPEHPLGSYAVPDDIDQLTLDDVRQFVAQRYRLADAQILLAGDVDETIFQLVQQHFGTIPQHTLPAPSPLPNLELGTGGFSRRSATEAEPTSNLELGTSNLELIELPSAVQSTLRVGRVMPFSWESRECALFSVLNTLLGGYFGSRLMTNLREDKGYTYGIYSQLQIFRGNNLFFITADVAAESTQAALHEIMVEIERLRTEPVSQDELQRVCSFMRGDFLRSIDGIFEISERYRQMAATACDERFTQRYFEALDTATPERLQQLAHQLLDPQQLITVIAGPHK